MELPRITIKEIEEKEFNIVRTDGYDPQEVDEYLDRIMDEMARQIDEIAMLRQELQAAKARPAVQAPVQPVPPVQPVRQQSGGAGQALEILEMAQRVKEETIAKALRKAAKTGAAAPALPVKDTIKVVKKDAVVTTPDRSKLMAVQTPQCFDKRMLMGALNKAVKDQITLTDDCSAMEYMGLPV